MLKKMITYKDLDDNDVTEEFYFNLSVPELTDMAFAGTEGDFKSKLEEIISSEDKGQIIATFKMIIEQSVGRRSEDGKRFIKSKEIRDEFMQTDAYSALFMEMFTDPMAAANFIVGIVPKNLADKLAGLDLTTMTPTSIKGIVDAQLPAGDVSMTASGVAVAGSGPAPRQKKVEDYSLEELRALPYEEFEQLVSMDIGSLPKEILVIAMQRRASNR